MVHLLKHNNSTTYKKQSSSTMTGKFSGSCFEVRPIISCPFFTVRTTSGKQNSRTFQGQKKVFKDVMFHSKNRHSLSTFSNTRFTNVIASSFRINFLEVREQILCSTIISFIRKVVGCKLRPEFQGLFKTL